MDELVIKLFERITSAGDAEYQWQGSDGLCYSPVFESRQAAEIYARDKVLQAVPPGAEGVAR